jgi:hypothetical protein
MSVFVTLIIRFSPLRLCCETCYRSLLRQPGVPQRAQAHGIRKGPQPNLNNPKSTTENHHSIFARRFTLIHGGRAGGLGRDMRVSLEAHRAKWEPACPREFSGSPWHCGRLGQSSLPF